MSTRPPTVLADLSFPIVCPPFVKGPIFDRKQFETRPNVWPGTIVRLRQLMASDGPVANIMMTRHGYDDVIRKFAKRVVDTRWTAAGPSVAWDRRSSEECRLIQLLPVPLLFVCHQLSELVFDRNHQRKTEFTSKPKAMHSGLLRSRVNYR